MIGCDSCEKLKSCLKEISRSEPVFYVAIFLASKMATLFRPSRLIEKLARALEVPLYQLFYDGEEAPMLPNLLKRKSADDIVWGSRGKNSIYFHKLVKCLSKATDEDRKLLMAMTQKVAELAATASRNLRNKKIGLQKVCGP